MGVVVRARKRKAWAEGMAGMPLFAHVGRRKKITGPGFSIKFPIENHAFGGLQNTPHKNRRFLRSSSAAQAG